MSNLVFDDFMGALHYPHCKDRLLRFGAELVFALCELQQIEVVIINKGEQPSFEEELAKDVLEIIHETSCPLTPGRQQRRRACCPPLRADKKPSRHGVCYKG